MQSTKKITEQTQPINTKSNAQATSQLTSKNKLLWLLAVLVVLLSGSTGILAYQYFRLKQQADKKKPDFVESTITPSLDRNDKANSQEGPYQARDVVSIINQDEDWGTVTVKRAGNEINAMRAAKYSIDSPIQISKVVSYGGLSPCPVIDYRLSHNNQVYDLDLFLGHHDLPLRFTRKATKNITLKGKQFTRENHFKEDDLAGIFYRSSTLTISDKDNNVFEYTWTAYLMREDYGNIDENVIAKVETILSSIEINEINPEKNVCELIIENNIQEK